MLTVFLMTTVLYNIPVKAQATIKIGIIGPVGLPHWEPAGMKPAAEMARDEINIAGGVDVGGEYRNIELVFANEYALPEPDPIKAQEEIRKLIVDEECEFIIGGFRTEVTGPMIEVAMEYHVPFFIDGAATTELISDTVGIDYAKYKYLFRNMPPNVTSLLKTTGGAIRLKIDQMKDVFGTETIKVAVQVEDLAWMDLGYNVLRTNYNNILGDYAEVVTSDRIPEDSVDCATWLQKVTDNDARIIIHMFSGRVGAYYIAQWHTMEVNATPVGINVLAQLETHWADTDGGCEYETLMNSVGTRTPITPLSVGFWDNFVSYTGVWPIYTAFGAYDSVYGLKEAIETAGTTDPDALVPVLEAQERDTVVGKFKYTADHDVFVNSLYDTWPEPRYGRAFMVQWQAGKMEVVYPIDQPFSKEWKLPPWMVGEEPSKPGDFDGDGDIDFWDILAFVDAYRAAPGTVDPRADFDDDGDIDFWDILAFVDYYRAG